MSDLDGRLARALDEAVPQPPRELDPEPLRSATPGRRRRSLTPALAAAAIVVVAVGVGLVSHHSSSPAGDPRNGPTRHGGSTGQASPSEHTPPVTHGPGPDLITAHYVRRLLAAAPVVPGAQPVDHSPVAATRRPMDTLGSPNVVRRTRWWTVPGTMDDALAYFSAHPPAGTTSDGSSTSGGPTSPTVEGLEFDATGQQWLNPDVYTALELLVTVAPAPHGVAIRVDAEAIWLPRRTAAEHIPDDVTSVDVVVDRLGNAPTLRRTLGAADARSLAALIDREGVLSATMHCALSPGLDTLTFHDRAGDVRVVAEVGGCGYVTVGPPGQHNPPLGGGNAVDSAVLHALGLPRDYGR